MALILLLGACNNSQNKSIKCCGLCIEANRHASDSYTLISLKLHEPSWDVFASREGLLRSQV